MERCLRMMANDLQVLSNRAFESSFNAPHINSGSLMPTFYLKYNYPTIKLHKKVLKYIIFSVFPSAVWATEMSRTVKEPIRVELNIDLHCESANQNRAKHWSCTVKQPIRAELNIELHCESANQSRAQHWAALWISQSEQSSTLSCTVKQPIRAEPNCETANQSRA